MIWLLYTAISGQAITPTFLKKNTSELEKVKLKGY
jgi:hypothetical protein